MTTALSLARPDDLDRLLPLVAAFHDEAGIVQTDSTRRAALLPMLEGSPHGVTYLIGPGRAPIGYIVISFGWSNSAGSMAMWMNFTSAPACAGAVSALR